MIKLNQTIMYPIQIFFFLSPKKHASTINHIRENPRRKFRLVSPRRAWTFGFPCSVPGNWDKLGARWKTVGILKIPISFYCCRSVKIAYRYKLCFPCVSCSSYTDSTNMSSTPGNGAKHVGFFFNITIGPINKISIAARRPVRC